MPRRQQVPVLPRTRPTSDDSRGSRLRARRRSGALSPPEQVAAWVDRMFQVVPHRQRIKRSRLDPAVAKSPDSTRKPRVKRPYAAIESASSMPSAVQPRPTASARKKPAAAPTSIRLAVDLQQLVCARGSTDSERARTRLSRMRRPLCGHTRGRSPKSRADADRVDSEAFPNPCSSSTKYSGLRFTSS
jgi:cell division septation protein DedD